MLPVAIMFSSFLICAIFENFSSNIFRNVPSISKIEVICISSRNSTEVMFCPLSHSVYVVVSHYSYMLVLISWHWCYYLLFLLIQDTMALVACAIQSRKILCLLRLSPFNLSMLWRLWPPTVTATVMLGLIFLFPCLLLCLSNWKLSLTNNCFSHPLPLIYLFNYSYHHDSCIFTSKNNSTRNF